MEQNNAHEQIISILKEKGPSLPIQIAKQMNLSSLFISAYLSELAGEKRIKISHLKVGGSPLYFSGEQEEQLENFYKYLHPREAEAFLLLKKNKILKDSEQKPAIRVALRSIRDFSIGFKKDEEIYWRYFLFPEEELNEYFNGKEKPKKVKEKLEQKKPKKTVKKKNTKKTRGSSVFFEQVKAYLSKIDLEIENIESYDKKEIVIKVKDNLDKEYLLFAYNKKTITDKDIMKAYKKAQKSRLKYSVLFKGEFSKKLKDTVNAYKNLISGKNFLN